MMFKIGDKVRIALEYVNSYWENPGGGWTHDSATTFERGRVFTVTKVFENGSIYIDDGAGGSWGSECIRPIEMLPEDLFTL